MFPPHQQPQIRSKLSFVLQGIVSQQLLARHNAPGRVMALEVLVPNAAIRNLIREDKVHQIYSAMQVGQEKYAMQTLNQSLFSLYQRRLISQEEAMGRSVEVDELRMMMEGARQRRRRGSSRTPAGRAARAATIHERGSIGDCASFRGTMTSAEMCACASVNGTFGTTPCNTALLVGCCLVNSQAGITENRCTYTTSMEQYPGVTAANCASTYCGTLRHDAVVRSRAPYVASTSARPGSRPPLVLPPATGGLGEQFQGRGCHTCGPHHTGPTSHKPVFVGRGSEVRGSWRTSPIALAGEAAGHAIEVTGTVGSSLQGEVGRSHPSEEQVFRL